MATHSVDIDRIILNMGIENISLSLDNAVPCGLIVNELVSNSLKHAFPKDRKGEVRITLHSVNEDEVELIVKDDGVGLPEGLGIININTLGLHLVKALTEYQLKGKVEFNRTDGTQVHIKFKKVVY